MTALTVAAQIDCDVHVAPRSLEVLVPHMDPYWADYISQGRLFLEPTMNGMYPSSATAATDDEGSGVPGDLSELSAGPLADGASTTVILNCITPFDVSHNLYYEAALCRAVNDWLQHEWLERDPRTRASLVVPTDPDAAVEEIERRSSEAGFVQILLPVRSETPYGNKRYHKVYAAAEKHGLPVALHAWGRVGNAPTASGFANTYLEDYAFNSQAVAQSQVVSLVAEGVFSRFPRLRVVLLECGFSWLAFLLWRFDRDWKGLWREVPWVSSRPSQAVLEHIRFSTAPAHLPADPGTLSRFAELLPWWDLLLYSSDYPHRHGGSVDPLLSHLGDEARESIRSGNAAALYGLG